MLIDLLQRTFFGNTALSYIVVAGSIVVGLIVVRIITAVVIGALHRWSAKTAGSDKLSYISVMHLKSCY